MGIKKLLEKNKIGFYEVETKDNGSSHFYIGIDKRNKLINIYLTDNVTEPSFIIDPNKEDSISNNGYIDPSILIHVVAKALKTFDLDDYPKFLSYQV